MHNKKPRPRNKRLRKQIRIRERVKQEEEEERVARDAEVTAEHGESGHRICGRKIRYRTESKARSRAAECQYHGAKGLRVYHCPYCDGWHLTSRV